MTATLPPKSGIYAVIARSGSPLDSRACLALGLVAAEGDVTTVAGRDPRSPASVQQHRDDRGITLVVGEVEEAADLASALALPQGTSIAAIARAALERYGSELPARMIGEWSLLHWTPEGGLTLAISTARRDPLLYCMDDNRVVVAPDPHLLADVPGIGRTIDPIGFAGAIGLPRARTFADDHTMVERVRQVLPGETVTIDPTGKVQRSRADPFAGLSPWRGTFADAISETEELLQQVMRARLARTAKIGLQLSGGLDSSVLARFVAQCRDAGQEALMLTSVVPAGCAIKDEFAFASTVAESLGLPIVDVPPADDINPFCPPDAVLAGTVGPPISNRHPTTLAMQRVAGDHGVTLLMNGTYGEASVSMPVAAMPGLPRRLYKHLRRTWRGGVRLDSNAWPFHAALNEQVLASLPAELRDPTPLAWLARPRMRAAGVQPVAWKSFWLANEFHPGALRTDYPYRDLRLLRLFARFDPTLRERPGMDRAPARMLLKGHVPDSISLRQRGLAATPDHYERLQAWAPKERERIAALRKTIAGEWIDLDWLDASLAMLAQQGVNDALTANRIQLTAMTAEFLAWWERPRSTTG